MEESYGIGPDERLTPKELGRVLGVTETCLNQWRRAHVGPPYIKPHGRIYYPKGAFEEWLKTRMHNL